MSHYMLMCAHTHETVFDICFSDLDLSIHMYLPVHATWLHFTYSLDCFLTTPRLACLVKACIVVESSVEIKVAQRKRGGSAVDRP